jgi:hypothetical protein
MASKESENEWIKSFHEALKRWEERRLELKNLGWYCSGITLVTNEQQEWLNEFASHKFERVGLGLWFEDEGDLVLFHLRWK